MNMSTDYAGKRVLVTGGSGFIGSALCLRLHHLGARIHAVSRQSYRSGHNHVQWWRGDLADRVFVQEVFNTVEPDIVFHLASAVTGQRDISLVHPTLTSNLVSTVNLLEAATRIASRRIVLAGSLEEPDNRDPAQVPSSPYAAAKWASSGYARMFHALYETPVTTARLFMVYGPGQKDLNKLIPYVSLCVQRGEQPRLASGDREVDWIYIDDVIDGLLVSGAADDINGKTLDIGSGKLTTTGAVAEILCGLSDQEITPALGALSDRPLEQVRRADIQRTHALTGWQPAISLEAGLKKTAAWYWEQARLGRLPL